MISGMFCLQIYLLILYIPLLIAFFDETNW